MLERKTRYQPYSDIHTVRGRCCDFVGDENAVRLLDHVVLIVVKPICFDVSSSQVWSCIVFPHAVLPVWG